MHLIFLFVSDEKTVILIFQAVQIVTKLSDRSVTAVSDSCFLCVSYMQVMLGAAGFIQGCKDVCLGQFDVCVSTMHHRCCFKRRRVSFTRYQCTFGKRTDISNCCGATVDHSMLSVTVMACCMPTIANPLACMSHVLEHNGHRTQCNSWLVQCMKEDSHSGISEPEASVNRSKQMRPNFLPAVLCKQQI